MDKDMDEDYYKCAAWWTSDISDVKVGLPPPFWGGISPVPSLWLRKFPQLSLASGTH